MEAKLTKSYLIIGGSSGIGKRLATILSADNRVFATYYKNQLLDIKDSNLTYHFCNVLDDTLSFDYLPDTIDGIVYCPGSINLKPFARIGINDFIDDYQLNVAGAIKIIQLLLPKLKAAKEASIILFSTVAVQRGFNFHSIVASSKGALEGLTKALAAEFAPSIRVNCIAPSITDTPLSAALLNSDTKKEANAQRHPLKRIGNTDDIANLAAFLLSDKSSWITGQIHAVDGGISSI
ncbi:MAG: SDR family oxidoreductase [Chitinophagaceae bacterium]